MDKFVLNMVFDKNKKTVIVIFQFVLNIANLPKDGNGAKCILSYTQ